MKIGKIDQQTHGFTLFEGVIVVFVLALVVAALIPALNSARHKAKFINCSGQLAEIGIAFRVWEGDHHDQYPMAVSVTNGGAMELLATGNVAACFQVMSNELSVPEILFCPGDTRHQAAANFAGLSGSNVSYFIGLDVTESDPQAVLSGDANLAQNGRAIAGGVLTLGTNLTTWTQERHGGAASVLFCDGSVEQLRQIGFTNEFGWMVRPTNRVVVP
jgi:prepilin-type processing-associated H-X9-DG protein